jgi:excinuclease ABC subunit C
VSLPRDSAALRLLQRVRDEAHRFAVAFHRQRRSRSRIQSDLSRVPGLGPVKTRRLLRTFGSLDGVLRASDEEVAAVVGMGLARAIRRVMTEP